MIAHWVHCRWNTEVHLRCKIGPSREDSSWKKEAKYVTQSRGTFQGPGPSNMANWAATAGA